MAKGSNATTDQINIRNRKATFEFEILDKFVAGIVLTGTEIKSIREGKANLQDGFCSFTNQELFIREMQISQYKQGGHYNHEPKRERKLLLNRAELRKLEKKTKEKGLTIIPLRLFVNERGLAKLEIAMAKGKRVHDKRESIKEKDQARELKRMKLN